MATNLIMKDPSEDVKLPTNKNKKWRDEVTARLPKRLEADEWDRVEAEIARRAMLDFKENCEPVQENEPIVVDDHQYDTDDMDEESEQEECVEESSDEEED